MVGHLGGSLPCNLTEYSLASQAESFMPVAGAMLSAADVFFRVDELFKIPWLIGYWREYHHYHLHMR